MPENEAVITPEEIQILLNLIEDEISVMFPLYSHFTLLKARIKEYGYDLSVLQGIREFEEQQSHFSEFSEEMPGYNDFINALLASGVMSYENNEKFIERAKYYSDLKKKTLYCPDTNLIYHRYLTNHFSDLRNVMLVETVRDEIEAMLNLKYQQDFLASLKKRTKYQSFLLGELINRRMKRSRLALLALAEYRALKTYGIEVDAIEKATSDKESNDRIIVKTLRRFEKERSAMPVLLTADNQMADLCEAEGIEFFHFKVPHAVQADRCTHESMPKLIYSIAVIFGVIRLNSVVIFGEFKGKGKIEELKVRFLDEKLWNSFEKHLRICRKLRGIEVEIT